ncbi:MAG: DUF1501 domain-containing protein [Sulfuritalea sp.]|nr:DUF1501 domain-containing protein [Sulfuritalea sp.]
MKRREFFDCLGIAGLLAVAPNLAAAAAPAPYRRLLILVELKGGNDGLNTLVPFTDPAYYALRPRIGIRREEVLPISERLGFHPALLDLLPLWQARELAVVQGVGYPSPNLSHFRSIEIWDTASNSNQYLQQGWLARSFMQTPPPRAFAADAVVVGSQDMGPFAGGGRVVALSDPERFARMARLAQEGGTPQGGALAHIQRVEADIRQAAAKINSGGPAFAFRTTFPQGAFGATVRTACQVLGSGAEVAVMRLTLSGFDTHQNQPGTHANLLKQLAEGLAALRAALIELKLWERTLVLSYAEFGRRPQENRSNGTDHGTASVHFALGGAVRGGLYGEPPNLARLDAGGNLAFGIDYRRLYATVLERWWGIESQRLLGGRHEPLALVG